MTDWSSAIVVAATGVLSVFAVLCLLSVSVKATGIIFERQSKQAMSKQAKAGDKS